MRQKTTTRVKDLEMFNEEKVLDKAGYLANAGLSVFVAVVSILILCRAVVGTDISHKLYDALNGGCGLLVSFITYPKKEEKEEK